MNIIDTDICGLKILEPKVFEDTRGKFVKTFNDDVFKLNGLNVDIKEAYYSISQKNAIRGMHFQIPPFDHTKLVYVPCGKILDVVLDIRKKSPTYGSFFSIELSEKNAKILVVPKGLAHGFMSLKDNTNVTYMQTTCYMPTNDYGIRYDSFGFEWGDKNFKLSNRDLMFPVFKEFDSPFIFEECL